MRTLCCSAAIAISAVVLLGAERRAVAYFPGECFFQHAKDDFKESALVVVGRVTTVERFRTSPSSASTASEKEPTEFFYLATVTVGQTLKGKVKPDDEILFYTGSYRQRKEDNTAPTVLRVANTHPAWTLEYDHVYLLALNPVRTSGEWNAEVRRDGQWVHAALEKREIWEPRSCHWSVHEISVHNRQEPGDKMPDGTGTVRLIPETYMTLYFNRWHVSIPKEDRFLLDEFLAIQKKGQFPGQESPNAPSAPNSQNTNPSEAKQ